MRANQIPDISARQLAAVLAVAENRSFVAAAAQLHISQPALTRVIRRVEDVLGVRLFERTTRTVRLTEAGREFTAVARRISTDLRLTVQSMRDLAEQKRGQVVISAIMSVANGILPEAIAAYRRDNPGIEIHVRDGIHGSVMDDVKSGAADFAISYLRDIPEGLIPMSLGPGSFDLVAHRSSEICTPGRTAVAFDELRDIPLVSMPTDSQTRRTLDATAALRGFALSHAVVVSQIPTVLSCVRAGVGVALVPSTALAADLGADLVRLSVHQPLMSVDIGIVRLSERGLSPAANGLLNVVQKRWPKH